MKNDERKTSWRDLIPGPLMAVLMGVGFYGYWWCYNNHVCMDGHLAHPDLQDVFTGHMIDLWWMTLWLLAPFVSILGKSIAVRIVAVALFLIAAYLIAGRLGYNDFDERMGRFLFG